MNQRKGWIYCHSGKRDSDIACQRDTSGECCEQNLAVTSSQGPQTSFTLHSSMRICPCRRRYAACILPCVSAEGSPLVMRAYALQRQSIPRRFGAGEPNGKFAPVRTQIKALAVRLGSDGSDTRPATYRLVQGDLFFPVSCLFCLRILCKTVLHLRCRIDLTLVVLVVCFEMFSLSCRSRL